LLGNKYNTIVYAEVIDFSGSIIGNFNGTGVNAVINDG
jgi:hypothetical protein